jgi:hypothetical protein
MKNADAEELFERVRVGEVVELHGARTEMLAAILDAPQVMSPAVKPGAAPPAPVVALM